MLSKHFRAFSHTPRIRSSDLQGFPILLGALGRRMINSQRPEPYQHFEESSGRLSKEWFIKLQKAIEDAN